VEASSTDSYRYNEAFTVKKGHHFFINGRIHFPSASTHDEITVKKDGSYHTLFGPCVAHSGVMYGKTDSNISLATTRITKSRLPTLPGVEELLQGYQRDFINKHMPLLERIAASYAHDFDDYTDMVKECIEHHDDTHPKRALRIAAWRDILDFALFDDDLWYLPNRGTLYKMKIFEIAKPGKVPRMIGDLGVHASLQGFRLTKFMKHAMAAGPIEYLGGHIVFCPKPDPFALEEVFRNLIDPPGNFYFVLFSDDSCVAVRTPGGVKRFNVDISSCDASHTEKLFGLLQTMVPSMLARDIKSLVNQCKTDISIHSIDIPKNKLVMQPPTPRLYSGSTLTTAINNLANILIAISIAEAMCCDAPDIIRAAARTGYIVTCEDCTDWHKLQFLKHSPVLDTDGVIRPLLNIGVLLRLSGTCKGDLPGRKTTPLKDRAAAFQASLLSGAYPKANFTLLDNMRRSAGMPSHATDRMVAKELSYKVVDNPSYPSFRVSTEEVFKRYDLDDVEILEVESEFGNCGFSEHYTADGPEKVLKADYGLSGRQMA